MHHRLTRRAAQSIGAVVGVALMAAACGTSAPSAADFSNQANGICQSYNAKLRSVTSQLALSQHKSKGQLEAELSSTLSLLKQGSQQLGALARPDSEGRAIDRALKAQNAQITDLQRLLAGIKDNNSTTTQSAEAALEESVAPLNQQFDILGMTACGTGSAPASNGSK